MALIDETTFKARIADLAAALTDAMADATNTGMADVLKPSHPLRQIGKLFKIDEVTGIVTTNTDYIDAAYAGKSPSKDDPMKNQLAGFIRPGLMSFELTDIDWNDGDIVDGGWATDDGSIAADELRFFAANTNIDYYGDRGILQKAQQIKRGQKVWFVVEDDPTNFVSWTVLDTQIIDLIDGTPEFWFAIIQTPQEPAPVWPNGFPSTLGTVVNLHLTNPFI